MIEFLVFFIFFLGCSCFVLIALTDIEWLCYKSKLFSCPCCKKRKAEEQKQKEEDSDK